MNNTVIICATFVALAAIAAAAVAVLTGHITGEAFVAVIGPLGAVFVGVGAHASGVASSSS